MLGRLARRTLLLAVIGVGAWFVVRSRRALPNHTTLAASDPARALAVPRTTWVTPIAGACPVDHPIKANEKSGIFHVPGGRFYARTIPERCYASADEATADGYRAAKA